MREPTADGRDARGAAEDGTAETAARGRSDGPADPAAHGRADGLADPAADGPADAPADAAEGDDVTISVARSGGIAGTTRRWSVAPSGDETERWVALLERCPWDEDPGAESGADRFQWRIEARIRQVRHEQVIPEEQLSGPWRELIDAVRAAAQG